MSAAPRPPAGTGGGTAGPSGPLLLGLGVVATGRALNGRRDGFGEKRSPGLGVQGPGFEYGSASGLLCELRPGPLPLWYGRGGGVS